MHDPDPLLEDHSQQVTAHGERNILSIQTMTLPFNLAAPPLGWMATATFSPYLQIVGEQ
jgi:hypothetical protein